MAFYGKGKVKFNKQLADWNRAEFRIATAKSEAQRKERIAILKEDFYEICSGIYNDVFECNEVFYHAWVDETELIPETFSFNDLEYAGAIIDGLRDFHTSRFMGELPF